MNPANEPFFGSKTMVLLCIGIAAIVGLVAVGVLVKVAFDIDAFELVAAGIAGISGNAGAGTYRNVQVDAPARQAYVAQQTAEPAGQVFGPPPRPQ